LKIRTLALSLSFLIVLIVCLPVGMAQPPPPPSPATMLWWDEGNVDDIAVSKDGQYVAVAASSLGVRFYSRSSGTPIWTHTDGGSFYTVAISADGNCVAAGNNTAVYFWNGAATSTGTPTWSSRNIGATPDRLLLSDDGNQVLASAHNTLFYWNDTKAISPGTSDVQETWYWSTGSGEIIIESAADLSSDGDYVVAGTTEPSVAYWKNAKHLTDNPGPDWVSTKLESALDVVDVVVSDDGNYVASVSHSITGALYYWAGAKALAGDPEAAWYHELGAGPIFTSIDMSSNGDNVIAGGSDGVYFWGGARTLTGKPEDPNWTYDTVGDVHFVAINAAGDYMAAASVYGSEEEEDSYIYFFDSSGELLWNPPYHLADESVSDISISSDGGTLAFGTYPGGDTAQLVDTGYRTKPSARPVGGSLIPVNKLQLVAPWIAVALAALALTIFATKRRREL